MLVVLKTIPVQQNNFPNATKLPSSFVLKRNAVKFSIPVGTAFFVIMLSLEKNDNISRQRGKIIRSYIKSRR